MPFTTCEFDGGNCPFGANSVYLPRTSCNDDKSKFAAGQHAATAVVRQSRTDFDSFEPMEIAASPAEVDEFVATQQSQGADALAVVVGEGREHPVRMQAHLPLL